MFVHVYIPLAFEMRFPSVPAGLVAVLAAFPHFASQAVHQVDITTVTHLNTDDTVNATFLASYRSHHTADFLRRSCTGLSEPPQGREAWV